MTTIICRIGETIKYFSTLENANAYLNDIALILTEHKITNIYNNKNYSISIFNSIDNSNPVETITLKNENNKLNNKTIINQENKPIINQENKFFNQEIKPIINQDNKSSRTKAREEYETIIKNNPKKNIIKSNESFDVIENPKLRKFRANKEVYNQIKYKIQKGIIDEDYDIPDLFLNEYPIFKILEDSKYSSIEEECNDFHKIYEEMYPEEKTENEKKIFIPHNISYLQTNVKEQIAMLNNMSLDEIDKFVDKTEIDFLVNKNIDKTQDNYFS